MYASLNLLNRLFVKVIVYMYIVYYVTVRSVVDELTILMRDCGRTGCCVVLLSSLESE